MIGPQAGEVLLLRLHAGWILPAGVDVDALPVALPAGRRLVQAAVPGDAVASAVFDDAGLLVEDGAVWHRHAVRIAGHGDLHVQVAAPDHPSQQFQGVAGFGIRRRERQLRQAPFHLLPQRLAALDGGDFLRFKGATHQQPHVAVVAHQPFDAAGGQRQGAGAEVAGEPVVAHRVLQRRNVEQAHQIAVVRRVAQAPVSVAEHGRKHSRPHATRTGRIVAQAQGATLFP